MDSSYYNALAERVGNLIIVVGTALVVFVPLGLWKLVEICTWCFNNVSFHIGLK